MYVGTAVYSAHSFFNFRESYENDRMKRKEWNEYKLAQCEKGHGNGETSSKNLLPTKKENKLVEGMTVFSRELNH